MGDGAKIKRHLRTRSSDRCFKHSQNNTVLTESVPEITTNDPSPVFPEELFMEIFLRLPVLFLLQLRCVCKSWKTLISSPDFAKRHLMSSTEYPRLISTLVTDKGTEIASYTVESVLKNESTPVQPVMNNTRNMNRYNIIGSCNGFLCLYDIIKFNVILWNPCNKLKTLISPPIDSMYINQYGFGYDYINGKFKLLACMQNGRNIASGIVTKIYTFGENSLRTIQNLPCTPNWYLGKCLNGTLNWPVKENGKQGRVLSFDLEKETYNQMLLPQFGEDDYFYTVVLDVLRNFLCMYLEYTHETVVWSMKEYGVSESWTKLMIIPHPIGIFNPTTMEPSFVDPFFISKNGIVLVKTLCSKLALYNIRECNRRENQYESASYFISGGGFKQEPHIHIYQESLLSLQW